MPPEVEEEVGPKEDPTSQKEETKIGKEISQNRRKSKNKENELPCGRGRTKIEREKEERVS